MRPITAALFLTLAGCGAQPTPNESTYREHLQVTAKPLKDKLVVVIKTPFSTKLHERYELWAIDKTKKEIKATEAMTVSLKRETSVTMSVGGLDVANISQVKVRYDVWEGSSEAGTHLFTGEKLADVKP